MEASTSAGSGSPACLRGCTSTIRSNHSTASRKPAPAAANECMSKPPAHPPHDLSLTWPDSASARVLMHQRRMRTDFDLDRHVAETPQALEAALVGCRRQRVVGYDRDHGRAVA